jgi:hypothetical protein
MQRRKHQIMADTKAARCDAVDVNVALDRAANIEAMCTIALCICPMIIICKKTHDCDNNQVNFPLRGLTPHPLSQ